MSIQEKLEEIFALCTLGTNSVVHFPEIAKNFWPVLDNNLTLCDLSGAFTVANSKGLDHLDFTVFTTFLDNLSGVKYPDDENHLDKLVEDLINARSLKYNCDNSTFTQAMDTHVIRVLLKYDIPLRRLFSAFAGRGVKVGGGLTWDEVKRMEVGMDIEGFISFAGAVSLIPTHLTLQQCTSLARDVLERHPLLKSSLTLSSTLLYPQFQLLLCFTAVVVVDTVSMTATSGDKPVVAFGRGLSRQITTSLESPPPPLHKILTDLLQTIGINTAVSAHPTVGDTVCVQQPSATTVSRELKKVASSFEEPGTVVLPASKKPDDLYSRQSNNNREAIIIRMEKLFDEVVARVDSMADIDGIETYLEQFPTDGDESVERRAKQINKPVVIGDTVPLPLSCPSHVQHSLEAALAHHNLGSFEEALKYLETAKMQLIESERMKIIARKKQDRRKSCVSTTEKPADGTDPPPASSSPVASPAPPVFPAAIEVDDSEIVLPAESKFYILACKGNVYQSCGDDEQSLLHYMLGWEIATTELHGDWETVFINSVGLLAYYNLHYELALKCFTKVGRFREMEYGFRSADTATAWNNQACCLYSLSRRGAARVLFERARDVFCESLGSRHPRSVVASKNCEKAKRSQTIVNSQSVRESIPMRTDFGRLLIGSDITIKALPPIKPIKKQDVSKKKGAKKKKL
mmetsp:Transcript_22243/g.32358  ORF Transcript_22243/g.32358 Transcript_22243/m.32358 type:complete len:688 (+) Transcript_22243:128-2191(+)